MKAIDKNSFLQAGKRLATKCAEKIKNGWSRAHYVCYIDQGILGCQPSLTPCAVRDGGWSAYGDWGPCSRRCYWPGEEEAGVRTRRRSCTNPTPDGGQECRGEEEEPGRCELNLCGESLPPLIHDLAECILHPRTCQLGPRRN